MTLHDMTTELGVMLMCMSDFIHDESKFTNKDKELISKAEEDYKLIKTAVNCLETTHIYKEKEKNEYFFKITTLANYSCVIKDKRFKTKFIKDKWVYPKVKGSKFFCFDTLENAKAFIKEFSLIKKRKIWKCIVKNGRKLFLRGTKIYDYEETVDFWTKYDDPTQDIFHSEKAFEGTIGADAVKLIEEVKE